MFELQKALDLCGDLNASFSIMKRLEAVKMSLGDLQRAAENANEDTHTHTHRHIVKYVVYMPIHACEHGSMWLQLACFQFKNVQTGHLYKYILLAFVIFAT